MTDAENGLLNPLGDQLPAHVPGLRQRRLGRAHAATATTIAAREWKYVPVRRMALFLEESLYRGTQWVVFEPNDEPLWAQIRLNVGAFMQNLFRQGAFQGTTPREAYFVKCDSETTTQTDINLGIVNILVGFAPLKPAEFVVIKLQQMAGQIRDLSAERRARAWHSSPSMPQRFDPYKNFKFRVKWDGRYVAGISKVRRSSARPRWSSTARAATRRRSRKSPGRTKYEAITLERGVTHDTEFEKWANKVWNFGSGLGAEVSLKDFRKDIIIEVYNEAGQLAHRLQGLPLLGVGVPGAARPRRQRQRRRDPAHQARERRLGARLRRRRADRADVHRAGVMTAIGRCDPRHARRRTRADAAALWERCGRAHRSSAAMRC